MKNIPLPLSIFLVFSLLLSCSKGSFQETERGLIITLPPSGKSAPRLIKIEVEEENIFRVSAVPEKNFPERTSLSVLPQKKEKVPFTVTQSDNMLEIASNSLTARVSLSDGQITFRDSQGEILLREVAGGEKALPPSGLTIPRAILSGRYLNHRTMRPFSDLDNTRVMSGTTRERTKSSINTTPRSPYPLWCPIKTTVFCGTTIR